MKQHLGLVIALLTGHPLHAWRAEQVSSPAVAYPDHAVPRLEGVTVPGLPAVTGRIVVDQFGCSPE